jgi:hypothetical protein
LPVPTGKNWTAEQLREYLVSLFTSLGVTVVHGALFFKHPAYRNEAEYRLLQMRGTQSTDEGVKYRAKRSMLVPYIELDWAAEQPIAVAEIVIGPSNARSKDKTETFVRECLARSALDLSTVPIRHSAIPYQG